MESTRFHRASAERYGLKPFTRSEAKCVFWLLDAPLPARQPLATWLYDLESPYRHPERIQPAAAAVHRQLHSIRGELGGRLVTRAEFFITEITRQGSIVPTAFPSDDDGGVRVGLLWVAGGEKLLVDLGESGAIYVRHVAPNGTVLHDDELPWHDAVFVAQRALARLSSKTWRAKRGVVPGPLRDIWVRD